MTQKELDNIAILMDDDIREKLHNDMAPCTPDEFLTEYCKQHKEKYNEDFKTIWGLEQ